MSLDAFSSVTIGVSDFDVATGLWVEAFGMQVVREHAGNDQQLAQYWGMDATRIGRQLLLSTRDYRVGMVHLVEFFEPEPPVRLGANAFDLCPKNIDVYVSDLPARMQEMRAIGWQFRSDNYGELQTDTGSTFREIHMKAHDDINIVLLEVLDESRPLTRNRYGAVGLMIYTVPDHAVEAAFVDAIFSMDKQHQNLFEGAEIEKMVGLPPDVALDVSVWGSDAQPLGKLELVEYRGAQGSNLYPRAKPGATGVLHLNFVTDDITKLKHRLTESETAFDEREVLSIVPGCGSALSFQTPAGMRIDAFSALD